MNKFATIIVCLYILIVCSCANRQVIRQSDSEIERSIFLPKKNWQVTFGGQLTRRMTEVPSDVMYYASEIDINQKWSFFPVLDLVWPSISIGKHVEYYIPALCRIYLKKNIAESNGVERISGLNMALIAGLYGFSYSQRTGLYFDAVLALLAKVPISKVIWLETEPIFCWEISSATNLRYNFAGELDIPLVLGYQIIRKLSISGGVTLNGTYNLFRTNPNEFYYNEAWKKTVRTYDLDLAIPITAKYVFNHYWDVSVKGFLRINNPENVFLTSVLFFTYTW